MCIFFPVQLFAGHYRCRPAIPALSVVCLSAALITGCSGGDTASNTVAPSPTAVSAASLAVVKPVVDCSQLASVDLTNIGGAGSTITSATVTTTTVNGTNVSLCAVKGTLAPANTFEVALPVST